MSRGRRGIVGVVAAVLLSSACSPGPLAAPDGGVGAPASLPSEPASSHAPSGTAVVAYPDEPSTFLGTVGVEPARDDLAALWGLPLFRIDDAGQLRRGLVADWEVVGPVEPGWQVRLHLRSGEWSDGTPVDAPDVVASLQALRDQDPGRFGVVTEVAATADDAVAVTFDRPYAAWSDLLVEAGTMLPSEIVASGRPDADDGVPVSGGWFRLAEYEPGLRLVFEAHTDGPLGPPGLERLEVLFTPSFDTALGLLEDGDVDLLLGYLPLNGVPRATDLPDVQAAAPLGGTIVALLFRSDGAFGGDDSAAGRRGVAETVNVDEIVEGMLGPAGDVATSPWPTVTAPTDAPVGEVRENQEFSLLHPSGSEVLGFAARAVQRDLTSRGMTVDLVGVPAPRFSRVVDEDHDVALVVRRTTRRPSLMPFLGDAELARQAGASALGTPTAERALDAVAEQARIAPLFRIGVLHAWDGVDGVRPSSWLGAGFWNAGEWTQAGDG